MTSKICGSGHYYINEIFKIIRFDRTKKNTIAYIFVGEQPRDIEYILRNLEKGEKLSAKDSSLIKEHFGKNISNLSPPSFITKIRFVFQKIYSDDSITTIRKKIFSFLSTENDVLIEQNQMLFVKMKDKTIKILGPTWNDLNIEETIFSEPEPDYKDFVSKTGEKILIKTTVNINDQTLYDATKGLEFERNEIFLQQMEDTVNYLISKDIKIDNIMLDGYFLKYWPNFRYDYDSKQMFKESEKEKPILKAEDKLINFMETIPVDENMFTGCKIIQVLIHITNEYEHEFVDLLKILNLLPLDEKTPFMRYKDIEWKAPLYVFYKPLVESKVISEKQMKDWVSATKKVKDATDQVIKEVQYSVRGLTIKRYIYTLDDEPKYATINIHRNGNIEIRIAFKEKQEASMKDVYLALKDIGKLIDKINEIPYKFRQEKIPKNVKLTGPEITYNEAKNLLEFHGRTKLILLDTISGVKIPENYNFREMNEFANRYMTPFLSPILARKEIDNQELLSKFKRVSFYSRMNLEYEFIHKTIQKDANITPLQIAQLLYINYYLPVGKKLDDAVKTYKDWERKYGYMGSQGKARQTGIEIRVKHGKIHFNGSKNVMQLTNASVFMAKFLNLFFNKDKFIHKKEAKEIFTDELSKIKNTEDLTILNKNNRINIPLNLDYNYGNTFNDIYSNEDYLNKNTASNENISEELKENQEEEEIVNDDYLAKNTEIGKDIRLDCGNKESDRKHSTCADYCDDSNYTLRRLQKYDLAIFGFKDPDKKFAKYSRQCQQSQDRQPLVMKNDPAKNPKIDPESYENAIQYGSSPDRQNWYICARVWCPYEEIPIKYSTIEKDIVKRPTARKGICETAKCPSCLKQGRVTWLKIVPKSKFNPYVGFLDDSFHPNHLCMPCCFKMPMDNPKSKGYAKFMKCLGKNVDNISNGEGQDYIMGRDKMPLTRGRFGLLPINLAKLFKSTCDTGKMIQDKSCHLRYGVKDDNRQSFLQAIAAVKQPEKQVNMLEFKKYLFETKLTQRVFNSINNGELAILFDDGKSPAIENFKKYMMTDNELVTEEFLWDFLQRPGILEPEGVNIFILTSKSILCPFGFNSKEFFDKNRKSIVIYTDGRYYEPIFFVQNRRGGLDIKKVFDVEDSTVNKIYTMAINNCVSKDVIDWEKIRKESLRNTFFEIKPQLTAKELHEKYDGKIIAQLKDSYNKAIGFINDSGFYLPFKPQGEILEIPVQEKYNMKSLKSTMDFYYRMSGQYDFPYLPKSIYRNNDGDVVAIQLENNVIVPVIKERYSAHLIESQSKYYYNANKFITEASEKMDERAKITLFIIYIQESYERLRMELARNLQLMPDRERIVELIYNKEIPKKTRRDQLYKILEKICSKITIQLDELPFPIEKYVKPLIRRTCYDAKEGKCQNNPHCYFSRGECKLIILKKSPVDGLKLFTFFVERLTEELLRNKLLRDEIIEDKLDEIINKSIEVRNDEIVIDGARDLLQQVSVLYAPKKEFLIKNEDMFSTTEPTYKGVNKEKYMTISKELTLNTLNLKELPSFWKPVFGPKVRFYDEKILDDSLYFALLRVCPVLNPDIKNANGLKNLQIEKIESLTKQDFDKEPSYKNIDSNVANSTNRIIAIYKKVNGNVYKNINTLTQLKEFIKNSEYPANQVDIFLLSLAMGINIIVLEKRVKKRNAKGFYYFINSLKKDFIILLEQPMGQKITYSMVGKGNNYIFKRKELPKYILEKCDIANYNDNQPNIKYKNNTPQPKKIKIKLAKKKIINEIEELLSKKRKK